MDLDECCNLNEEMFIWKRLEFDLTYAIAFNYLAEFIII